MNPTVAAPFTASELGSSDDAGKLLDGVPLPHLLALNQGDKEGFNLFKPFFHGRHRSLPFDVPFASVLLLRESQNLGFFLLRFSVLRTVPAVQVDASQPMFEGGPTSYIPISPRSCS